MLANENVLSVQIQSTSLVQDRLTERKMSPYVTPVNVGSREVVGEYISKIGRDWKPETGFFSMCQVYMGSIENPVYWFSKSVMDTLKTSVPKEAKLFVSKFSMVMGATVFHAYNEDTGEVFSVAVSGKPTIKFMAGFMEKYGATVFLDSGWNAPEYVRTPKGVVKVRKIDALSTAFVSRWSGALT